MEQAYNPSHSGSYCRKVTSSRPPTVKVKKQSKQTSKQASNRRKLTHTPPPKDRASDECVYIMHKALGSIPSKGRGRFQSIEIASYRTKRKTPGHSQWKQNSELQMGS